MSWVLRGRTVSYDNIAVGQVSGRESTMPPPGALAPAEKVGGKDNIAVAVAFGTTVIADNQQVGLPTMAGERLG